MKSNIIWVKKNMFLWLLSVKKYMSLTNEGTVEVLEKSWDNKIMEEKFGVLFNVFERTIKLFHQ